jgi:hypothetical protein
MKIKKIFAEFLKSKSVFQLRESCVPRSYCFVFQIERIVFQILRVCIPLKLRVIFGELLLSQENQFSTIIKRFEDGELMGIFQGNVPEDLWGIRSAFNPLLPRLFQISDVQLAIFSNIVGVMLFLLVVGYHYIAANSGTRYTTTKPSVIPKSNEILLFLMFLADRQRS